MNEVENAKRKQKRNHCQALFTELKRDIEDVDNTAFSSLWYARAQLLKESRFYLPLMQVLKDYKAVQNEQAIYARYFEKQYKILEDRFGKQGLNDLAQKDFSFFVAAVNSLEEE